jgi:phosphosulfolactate phosphohydrolase-like enzyme
LQVQAKAAHRALLWRALFAMDKVEARIAQRSATRDVAFCMRLLPGS